MSACALRAAGTRRLLHAPTRATVLPVRDATDLRDGRHGHQLATRPSQRAFHTYFVTHLPSSSLHPDSRSSSGPGHKLPRSASTPHTAAPGSAPAAAPPNMPSRDLTVVRIPLRSAKHHFGVSVSRGQRPHNEDTNQAGTLHMPAFAKRVPISLVRRQVARTAGEGTNADSALGDPQVFYFGVFDGHGGSECSEFLRDELHGYIEEAAAELGLKSSLKRLPGAPDSTQDPDAAAQWAARHEAEEQQQEENAKATQLQVELLAEYKRTIGGYFKRFRPQYFNTKSSAPHLPPSGHLIGGTSRFKGGSTASVALISTPTTSPYWHPAAHSSLAVAHVGDTRILLCETASGKAVPVTKDHRPSSPGESRRLRRWVADSLVTDSFGEERIQGLANSRSFGDMQSKRIGVSAEPDITRVELRPAEYSFLVLMSDGVSGTLSDQEIVDVVKEAGTPEEGARKVVEYATEVSEDGDNATCLVVRLGAGRGGARVGWGVWGRER
ncbi:Protein phosphatase 2C 6 [Collariella sp. IMI 366227]|nr:Protein phosphatase 2C 6 [Collariella sp. IMI 366227]